MQEARQMLEMLGWKAPVMVGTVSGGVDEKPLERDTHVVEGERPEPIPEHLPLGEAVSAAKKANAKKPKPIVAIHRSGEIKYFDTVGEASGHCGVSMSYIYSIVGRDIETQGGWKFEYDDGR